MWILALVGLDSGQCRSGRDVGFQTRYRRPGEFASPGRHSEKVHPAQGDLAKKVISAVRCRLFKIDNCC